MVLPAGTNAASWRKPGRCRESCRTRDDVPLMRSVLRALPNRAALLLLGDVDQLPSVGPGQVLADIMTSGAVPVVRTMAKVVEAKIVIPLKSSAICELSNIDKVLLEIEDMLAARLAVAVDVTSGITRKLPPRKPKVGT